MKARIMVGDVLDRLAELARKRIGNEAPMFNQTEVLP